MNKKVLTIILSATMILSAGFGTVYARDLNEVNKEKSSVKKEIKEADNNLQVQIDEAKKVQENYEKAQKEVDETEARIANINTKIEDTKKAMKKREKDLQIRIRTMYKNGSAGFVDVVLHSKDMSEFLSNVSLLQRIYKEDQKTLTGLEEDHKALEIEEENLKLAKKDLEKKVKKAKEEKKIVDKKKAELQKVVNKLQGRFNQLDAESSQIEAEIRAAEAKARAELEKAQAQAEAQRKAQQQAAQQRQSAQKQNNNQTSNVTVPSTTSGNASHTNTSPISTGSLMRPVYGPITSYFGYRTSPIPGLNLGYHRGIDFGVPTGTAVRAADGGIVSVSRFYGGYGNAVVIMHGNNISTLYAHNSSLVVSAGQRVSKGQVIAYSGSTGNSTGPHCHFEVRVNGVPQNPLGFI